MKSVNVMKCKLVKESEVKYQSISCASDVVSIMRALDIQNEAEEHFYVVCMNVKGEVVGVHEVSHGDLSMAPVHPREVFKRALLNNAASVILSHNHPSGNPEPSDADRLLTERLSKAGDLLGVKVLDHIIIASNEHFSFAGQGLM